MKDNLSTTFNPRQYMISQDFELYYYRDRNLPQVESHRHDYYEFYFFMEGDVSLSIENVSLPLHTGDVVLIPPEISHHAVIHNPDRSYCRFVFWISKSYYRQLTSQSEDYSYLSEHTELAGCRVIHNDSIVMHTIQSKLIQLIEELHGDRFGKQTIITLYISDLLLYLNRLAYEQDHPQKAVSKGSLYYNIIRYIDGHLFEPLTLDSLAGVFFVSKYHIAHIFKENIGMSVCRYITKKRLQACREAILDDHPINDVYLNCGFQDYSGFYRAFKKEYGISPREYRTQSSNASRSIT